jgi:hypothetical protein
VQAITGIDYAADFRGAYQSKGDSEKVLCGASYEGIFDVLTDRLGDPVPVSQLKRGDVVLYTSEHGQTVGICA